MIGELVAVIAQELREDVGAVEPNGAHPRQMVEAYLTSEDASRGDLKQSGDVPLDPDSDIAQPDRAVPRVEERPGHDPDRVREVDDPRVVLRSFAGAGSDLEHDRDGSKRLGETAGARGLLADAAAGEWDRLIREAGGLAADAELDEDEGRPVKCHIEIVRHSQRAVVAGGREHPPCEAADDLAALGVDVMQDEFPQVEAAALACEPRNQFGRICRASANDRDLHITP